MKKIVLTLIILLSSLISFAQKNWVKQKLNNSFVVSFPAAPTQTAGTTYAYRDSASNTIYTATYSRIAEHMKIEQKAFHQIIKTSEFATEFLNILEATLPQYELDEIVIKKEKNQIIYLTNGKEEATEKSIFLKVIFVDGLYYSLSVVLPDSSNSKRKDIFLSSYQIVK